eukprot:TRINITY_DN18641_c0_g1_i1.p1 TRINITY_DN18641_c0_g1~~TRINITY_DN18641_c0_g1_i1.p1  ORF type:complete len:611 (-),score=149.70 TRINITY_DN18641_c0_g1_i1:218-2050(-)
MAEANGHNGVANGLPNGNGEAKDFQDSHQFDVEKQDGDLMSRSRNASLSLFRDDIPHDFHENCSLASEPECHEPGYTAKDNAPVVIVSSEISPWSKSGGLALVTASLALEFASRGRRTMALSPMYDYYEGVTFVEKRKIWLFHAEHEIKYFHMWHPLGEGKGVDYIFVDHPSFHRPGGLYYNQQEGVEYADNLFRFALFTLACLEAPCCLPLGGVCYGDRVLFLSNDWQSALLPVYLTHKYRPEGRYKDSRCIFVVHNFGYQGIYPLNKLVPSSEGPIPIIVKNVHIGDLDLDHTCAYEHLIYQYPDHERNYDGDDGNVWNLTKGAVLTCDRLLTVSEGYAEEMKTPEGGFRLDGLVKIREFFHGGILNGIDVGTWNPRSDPHIAQKYDQSTLAEGKAKCKQQLQEEVGLNQDAGIVLVSFVGRLTHQKGIDLIFEALDWLMHDTGNGITGRVQVFLMGNGDECHVNHMKHMAQKYPGRIAAHAFTPRLEHLLYAGSDLLLMPSRYEPCGLPQMCAQRYATVPIVTLCGGLKDSVVIEPEEEATGFGILPLDINKLKEITYKALDTYYNRPEDFRGMQLRGIKTNFSWCRRIDEYEKNFDWAMHDPPYVR